MAKKTKKKVVKKVVLKEPEVIVVPPAEEKKVPVNTEIPPARNIPKEHENHPVCPHCMNEIFELKWAVYGDGKITVVYCKSCLRAIGTK